MKTKFNQWLKDKGINFFITLVVVLIIASVGLTFYGKHLVMKQMEVKAEVLKVRESLQKMHTHVNIADLGLRGYIIIKDDKFLLPFNDAKKARIANLDSLELYLTQQQFPQIEELENVRVTLDEYFGVVQEMVNLRAIDSVNDVLQILSTDPGYNAWKVYSQFIDKVIEFEDEIDAHSHEVYEATMQGVVFVQLLLLMVGGLCGYLSFIAKKGEKARKALFKNLDEHNRKLVFDDKKPMSAQDENAIMQSLITNLQKAFTFIRAIASGNYQVKWEGLTDENRDANQENLVGELVLMREQMKQVKEADDQRLWATEALSAAAKITRTYQQEISILADEMLKHLIECLGANQAGLFVIDEEKTNLELIACYAYERKKFLKKTIEIGEGLLGQAFLEAETIYLTEVPEKYVNITSGLGKALPRSILIVPLKYNEEVMGVLEIASFKPMEEHQIQLVENLGEVLASSLSTLKTNEQTRKLLEQSQEQAELLHSQEEEMRQNMEELQATQEEMQRKTKEYEAIIKDYETKMDKATENVPG